MYVAGSKIAASLEYGTPKQSSSELRLCSVYENAHRVKEPLPQLGYSDLDAPRNNSSSAESSQP